MMLLVSIIKKDSSLKHGIDEQAIALLECFDVKQIEELNIL